jgi:hypothetical protein
MFIETMHKLLGKIDYKNKNLIIGGDFNMHFNTNNKYAQSFSDLLQSYGLYSHVKFPTRGLSAIDNVFSNIITEDIDVTPVNFHISDHLGISVNLRTNHFITRKSKVKIVRPLSDEGKFMFFKFLENVNWNFVDLSFDLNVRFQMFMNTIMYYYNLAFPQKQIFCKTGSRSNTSVKWFTPVLDKMRNTLGLICDAYNLHRTPELKSLLTDYKKRYHLAIRDAKIEANAKFISDNKNNPRVLWNLINNNRTSKNKHNNCEINPNDFNNFFSRVAENIINSLPSGSRDPISIMTNENSTNNIFCFKGVSEVQVRDAITKLRNTHSKDIYGLSVPIIICIKSILIPPLTKLCNYCIKENIFPNCLKKAVVIPLHKKGNPADMNNYRPISLLPAISKIFEKLLFEQILNFLHDNNLLSPQQFGFRTGSSPVKAVTNLVEKIIDCFERKEYYSTSFLDLSKAFDCVSRDILLRKLYTYNFHPSSTRLILSYLSDRSQCVRINEVLSDFSRIVYGVPQGSILGPILFLIYINDLSSYVSCADITLFADDTTVSNAEISMENLLLKKNYSISLTEEWFLANRLNLNKDKTVHMMFTLKQFVGGVEYSEQTKYLGIYVDMQLTWNAHGEQMASKISRNIYLLRNLANNLPLQSLRLAYFALVHCHIEYGILIWGHSGTLYRIFRLQRRAVRVIANLGFRDDCRQHFAKLKILTLPAIFIYRCLEYIIKNPKLYPKLSSYHQYSTRSQDIDHISLRLTKSQDGIHYYCIKFFNSLPDSHKNLPPNQFLKHIKTYLLNKIIYSFDEFLNNSSNDLK